MSFLAALRYFRNCPLRHRFEQHWCHGVGAIYDAPSFAALSFLAEELATRYDEVVILVFYAALRDIVAVFLSGIPNVVVLTMRQAKGTETNAAILFVLPRRTTETSPVASMLDKGKLAVALSRARVELHILLAVRCQGSPEWDSMYRQVRNVLVPRLQILKLAFSYIHIHTSISWQ